MKTNIVLTGFMGTGKSSVGRELAKLLQMDFIDTDDEIEKLHGPIKEIFHNQGEHFFRNCEREIAKELSTVSNTVIATGGGLMINNENADRLMNSGKVFCLHADLADIVERLSDSEETNVRPLWEKENNINEMQTLLNERSVSYNKFEQVSTEGKSPIEIAKEISEKVTTREF